MQKPIYPWEVNVKTGYAFMKCYVLRSLAHLISLAYIGFLHLNPSCGVCLYQSFHVNSDQNSCINIFFVTHPEISNVINVSFSLVVYSLY